MQKQIKVHCFSAHYTARVNILRTTIDIFPAFAPTVGNPEPPHKQYNCIWDTGATNSAITRKVVDDLDLKPISIARVRHAQGESDTEVFLVNIRLPNGVGFLNVKVVEGVLVGDEEVLIGMDIIAQGDFAITHQNDKTTFSFRVPSVGHIDFAKQPPQSSMPVHSPPSPGRNNPCPCGSGKKYKKCCGNK